MWCDVMRYIAHRTSHIWLWLCIDSLSSSSVHSIIALWLKRRFISTWTPCILAHWIKKFDILSDPRCPLWIMQSRREKNEPLNVEPSLIRTHACQTVHKGCGHRCVVCIKYIALSHRVCSAHMVRNYENEKNISGRKRERERNATKFRFFCTFCITHFTHIRNLWKSDPVPISIPLQLSILWIQRSTLVAKSIRMRNSKEAKKIFFSALLFCLRCGEWNFQTANSHPYAVV